MRARKAKTPATTNMAAPTTAAVTSRLTSALARTTSDRTIEGRSLLASETSWPSVRSPPGVSGAPTARPTPAGLPALAIRESSLRRVQCRLGSPPRASLVNPCLRLRFEEGAELGQLVSVGDDGDVVGRPQDRIAAHLQQTAVADHEADPDLLAHRQVADSASVGAGPSGHHVVAQV